MRFCFRQWNFWKWKFENIFEYIYISIAWGSWLWGNNIGDSHKSNGWSIQFTPHDWILREKALAKLSILFHHVNVFSPCIASWQYSRFQIEPSRLMIVVYQIWNRMRSLVPFKFLQCFKEILARPFTYFERKIVEIFMFRP